MTGDDARTVTGPDAPGSRAPRQDVPGLDVPGLDVPGRTRPRRSTLAIRWVRAHPGMVVALAIPVVLFAVPQLFSGTFLNGDNQIQNLPMRALVGSDLDHGIWPLWNPYLFSGTPLLAGFNAGAAYPVTWLTAVIPLFTSWTITLVVAYDVALAGMYLFLRRQPMSTPAATLGAVTFAFSGYMTAQMVHIDLIEGASWLPWMLVAVHALTRGRRPAPRTADAAATRRRRARGWVVVLAVSLGMSLLTGNAEAIVDSGVLVMIYWIGRLVTTGLFRRDARRALASSVAAVACGVAGGMALGAAQWLTGLVFLSQSQRSATTYGFFTGGSLDNRLVTLVFSPFLLGSAQNVPGQYAGAYNFQEVTSYVGVLALIAACSLFLRRWRTRPEARHWWIWYVILVVGLLSALGGQTPFGHLMYAIPVINSERLINRNLLLVDCSLAVLLGWWVHLLLADRRADPPDAVGAVGAAEPPDPAGPQQGRSRVQSDMRTGMRTGWPSDVRNRWREGGRSEIVATCAPLAVMTLLCIFLWVDGPLLGRALDIQYPMSTLTRHRVAVLVTVQVAVAAWATWIVLAERRFTAKHLARLLTAALAVDLVLFNTFVIQPPITEAHAQANGPTSAAFSALVGNGRFIIYDPDRLYGDQLLSLGQTDLNIYRRLPSAQGYTALTDGDYFLATGSHYQEDLSPESLAGPVWDGLNVTTLLSLPGYFVIPVGRASAQPGVHPTIQFPNNPSAYVNTPAKLPDSFALAPGAPRRWYFGGVLTVGSFEVPVLGGAPARFRVGLVTTSGGLRWLPTADAEVVETGQNRTLRVSLPRPTAAGGIVLQPSRASASVVGIPQVQTVEAGAVALDGRMQFGVVPPHWRFTGMFGPFSVFRNDNAQGWAQLRGTGGGANPAGSSVMASAPGQGGGTTISVHATSPTVLVRSAAFSPGWLATVRSVHHVSGRVVLGPPTTATVVADGVLQQVALPAAGDYLVTFSYGPTNASVAVAVSGLAVVVLVLIGLAELVAARRRRRSGRHHQDRTGTSGSVRIRG